MLQKPMQLTTNEKLCLKNPGNSFKKLQFYLHYICSNSLSAAVMKISDDNCE